MWNSQRQHHALKRTACPLYMFLAVCCCLLITTAGPVYPGDGAHALPYYPDSPEGCEPETFRDVSPEVWDCLKTKLKSEVGLSVPSGDSGQISGQNATLDFSFNSAEQTLTLTARSARFSCKEIRNFVDSCRKTETVRQIKSEGNVQVWRISDPNVQQRETIYKEIRFERGDTVTVSAGGCVQHGGPGLTWTRYVDPQGPNSNNLYHGLIKLPGMSGLRRIGEFMAQNQSYVVPGDASGDMFLHLGYLDVSYSNNGYWGHDDGFNDQCKGVENAWVEIRIERDFKDSDLTPETAVENAWVQIRIKRIQR